MDEGHQDERAVLSETEILEVFERLQLSSPAEREHFLALERFGETPEAADESLFDIRFGNSTTAPAA